MRALILRLLHLAKMNHKDCSSGWIAVAAILGLSAVVLGAIAAHAISDPKAVAALEKAALYQLIHAVLLLVIRPYTSRFAQLGRWLILSGVLLFCGSIELKYLLGMVQATAVAPIGGVCLMSGWLMIGLAGFKQNQARQNPSSNNSS